MVKGGTPNGSASQSALHGRGEISESHQVSTMTYDEITECIDIMSGELKQSGDCLVRDLFGNDDGSLKVVTYTFDTGFALLVTRRPEAEAPPGSQDQRTVLEIFGGGAMGARPEPILFQHLLTRHMDFEWGGPFVRHFPSGTVTYGSRAVTTSDLLTQDNLRGVFSYLDGMVNMMGQIARHIALELIESTGGELLDGADPQHDIELLTAVLGPPSPDALLGRW